MKTATITLVLAAAAIGAGCTTTLERSRNLADPKVPAKTLAQQICSNCHHVDGNSESPNFPKLAAQQQEYLIGQLKMFRNHKREDPPGFEYMWGISRSLTDAQIEGLAAYFAAQISVSPGPGDPKLAVEGKKIFHEGLPAQGVPPCATCHGDHGQGNGQFPRIANQHADYVVKQLDVFQRTNERPDGVAMKAITHSLSQDSMKAVAAYLQDMAQK
jgi:cytochrome c553